MAFGVNLNREFKPLQGILVLFLKVKTTADVVDTTEMIRIDLYTRQIVV